MKKKETQIERKLFNSREVCEMLGICTRTLDRRISAGEIKPIIRGNRRYFTQKEINRYLGEEA